MLSEEKSLDQLIDDAMRRLGACFSKDEMRSVLEVLVTNTLKSKQVEAAVRAELAVQEPVAWLARGIHAGKVIATMLRHSKQEVDDAASVFLEHYGAADTVPLFVAPVVQPDAVMAAEKEQA